jgi:hypothetical protein
MSDPRRPGEGGEGGSPPEVPHPRSRVFDEQQVPFAIPAHEHDEQHVRLHLGRADLESRWSELEQAWREAELRLGSGEESDRAWRCVAEAVRQALGELQLAIDTLRRWP